MVRSYLACASRPEVFKDKKVKKEGGLSSFLEVGSLKPWPCRYHSRIYIIYIGDL